MHKRNNRNGNSLCSASPQSQPLRPVSSLLPVSPGRSFVFKSHIIARPLQIFRFWNSGIGLSCWYGLTLQWATTESCGSIAQEYPLLQARKSIGPVWYIDGIQGLIPSWSSCFRNLQSHNKDPLQMQIINLNSGNSYDTSTMGSFSNVLIQDDRRYDPPPSFLTSITPSLAKLNKSFASKCRGIFYFYSQKSSNNTKTM